MTPGWPSYDRAPPLSLPLPFLLASPCWLFVAGLCLAQAGPGPLDRFDPVALAAAHLLALGVLGNAMCGAALQILAVVAGVAFSRPRLLLHLLFWPLQLGCGLLAAAFLYGFLPMLLLPAAALLAWSLLMFAGFGLHGVAKSPARDATTRGMASALAALAAAAALGVSLAGSLGAGWPLPWKTLLDWHVLWALGGWLLGLIMAVAGTVVPMFQITPAYPAGWMRRAAALWPSALLVSGLGWQLTGSWLAWAPAVAVALAFAAMTWRLQLRSRRPGDCGRRFWQMAMAALTLGLFAAWVAERQSWAGWAALSGWLLLFGLGVCAVLGMLYKILPFLLWLDLQRRAPPGARAPATLALLPEAAQRRCLCACAACLALGCAMAPGGLPALAAGAAVCALAVLAAADAAGAVWRYRACIRGWRVAQAGGVMP
ncbi:hypothetical protein B0T49_16835 [Chromobacterium violaceum]|uniref:hypothetical protein n=1 Tax=Chromobacterium violaceum TaxID=536 RepID=UPI0009DAA9BC|nr:hypothetical protein [Chromobacterium violaceum]OQS45974.1 hypothetical protein B0T48_17620 [Chromobacterium violaceum]OQS47942.1 hypothetical protein B0T49_16835 [Chromobacterium violaceum]